MRHSTPAAVLALLMTVVVCGAAAPAGAQQTEWLQCAVKNVAASQAFYEKLGFKQVGGDQTQNWLILRSGETTIGLFQGMFERNTLTFNPGWTSQTEALQEFEDVREIQRRLKASGLALTSEADESTSGPASLTVIDPDRNPILIDQHVE